MHVGGEGEGDGKRLTVQHTLAVAIDIPFFFPPAQKVGNYTIFYVRMRAAKKYRVRPYLTSRNFGKLKTDNTIFYAAISAVKNICIERKIFCIVTRRPLSISRRLASPFRFSARNDFTRADSPFGIFNNVAFCGRGISVVESGSFASNVIVYAAEIVRARA